MLSYCNCPAAVTPHLWELALAVEDREHAEAARRQRVDRVEARAVVGPLDLGGGGCGHKRGDAFRADDGGVWAVLRLPLPNTRLYWHSRVYTLT